MQRHVQPAPVQQQNSQSEPAPAPVLKSTKTPPPPMAEVPDTYRGRLSQFRILEESRHALIEVRSPAVMNSFFFFALHSPCSASLTLTRLPY